MKAPPGSYLIAGRPRSRTAWLAALLFGTIPCYHDDVLILDDLVAAGRPFGFASPSLVAGWPERAIELFGECPIVVVERDAASSWSALQRWAGFELPAWRASEERFQRFLAGAQGRMTVSVELMDTYEAVNRIHEHCLGLPLCENRFRTFNLLRIEQHREKVERAVSVSDLSERMQSWPG